MPDPTATQQAAIEASIGSAQKIAMRIVDLPKDKQRLPLSLSAVIIRTLSKNSALMASKRVHGSNYRSKEFEV
jgi:hypothetical protein